MENKSNLNSNNLSQNISYRRKLSNLSNLSDKEQQIVTKQLPFVPEILPQNIMDIIDEWQFFKIQHQKQFQYENGEQGNQVIGIIPSDIQNFQDIYSHKWSDNDKDSNQRMVDKQLFKFYDQEDLNYYNFNNEKHFQQILKEQISEQTVNELYKMEKIKQDREIINQLNDSFLHNFKITNKKYHPETYYPVLVKATKTSTKCILKLVDECISDNIQYGFAITRPSGHHSGRLYMGHHNGLNGVAIAAQYASKIYKKNVVIIDLDVDFAKGTIDIIQGNSKIHLFDLFSGYEDKTSKINLLNVTNFPLSPGSGDLEYIKAIKQVIKQINEKQLNPSLLIISCGFDAAKGEQEGAQITKEGFETIFNYIIELQCKVIFQLEGGYNLESLGDSFEGFLNSLTKKLKLKE
ncbi:hypothetical protein PPERSA_07503 [Pseudocohnilembus persalinus]|uniref:Histone deacetylase domain-containing protein n=1 Tax=Pseudocohnilembus persalinus TaxID=266149 RepID=A0A0V0QZN3_PSEPJ|nr:hypothetical protein PPERSA_07503 [Pseudocohnilembus persalinus]|eukprot:KRX07753.1 hypothetical protein PPERSA_07503 [Pseudocohnilembus persalinus]